MSDQKMSIRVAVSVVVVLVALAVSAGSAVGAETPSPWFRLSSVSRPGNLVSGLARDEVQDVTVTGTAGEHYFLTDATAAEIERFLANEEYEKLNEKLRAFTVGEEPSAMQATLEELYGPGNVEASGGPGALIGIEPYVVTFKHERAFAPVLLRYEPTFSGASFKFEGTVTVSQAVEGRPDGFIVATAMNVGEAGVDGSGTPVRIVDTLPSGLEVGSVTANTRNTIGEEHGPIVCTLGSVRVVECSFAGKLPPYQQIEVRITVAVRGAKSSSQTGEENEVAVSGGGAAAMSFKHGIVVDSSPTPFGIEDYSVTPEEVGGAVDHQAGSHPFQFTTSFSMKQILEEKPARQGTPEPAELAKDLTFKLPAGLIGDPTAYPRCTLAQFNFVVEKAVQANACPAGSVIGVASVAYDQNPGGLENGALPLYNLEPAHGEPARFGFQPPGGPVMLTTSVRTGEDYGVTVHVLNVPQTVGFIGSTVTFWGVPGDPRHDNLRGTDCIVETAESQSEHAPCRALEESHPPPFLSLPTSCSGSPLETTMFAASWTRPLEPVGLSPETGERLPRMTGCGLLPFASEIGSAVDEPEASSPSGLKVDVHVPQDEALNAEGLAPADVKNITVTLPEGLQLNPSEADGLGACTQAQVGLNNANEASCPDASKIATAKITTPLLPNPLTGFVYLASPQNFAGLPENPFAKHVAMYLVVKDPVSGTLVKLAGNVELGGELGVTGLAPGQIRSTFADNPQLPFEDAEIEFFGGERAPLATPAHCGSYTTNALFEPWSNTAEHTEVLRPESHFDIVSGPNHTACPAGALPFTPSLSSGSTNINAGGFSPLVTTVSRPSGDQNIQSVVLHYPPGVSGILTGVPLCPEAQANAGTCPESSLIGETIVSVGVGGEPFTVTGGKVYLTEKYAGAPFGLSIVNPAKAGPFDLQEGRPVVVRAKIQIDPLTAALTVTTDASGAHAIPNMVEGFALQIQHVNVTITRSGFTFNPTSCNRMQVTGSVASDGGATVPVSVPFQVANCERLAFKPSFKVSTSGHTSRRNGASLKVKLSYPKAAFGSQANIREVKVDLPKQLPSRIGTLQQACPHTVFESDPAKCSSGSKVGFARASTPLLPVMLEGPAYFVSYGGLKFPELVIVLQGYGVTLQLHGETFIDEHTSITSSTFKTVPDAPVGSFELNLPEGPFSALAANANLCTHALSMPTLFVAQNGATLHQSTPVSVIGCKPAIRVVRHSVKGATVTLVVNTPSAGRLTAHGAGLTSVRRSVRAGNVTIALTLTKAEQAILRRHPGRRLRTKIKLSLAPKHGKRIAGSVTVLVG